VQFNILTSSVNFSALKQQKPGSKGGGGVDPDQINTDPKHQKPRVNKWYTWFANILHLSLYQTKNFRPSQYFLSYRGNKSFHNRCSYRRAASPGGLWAEVEGGQGGKGGRGRVGRVQLAVQLGEGGNGQPPRVHLNPPHHRSQVCK
jgi:hypothetical protein